MIQALATFLLSVLLIGSNTLQACSCVGPSTFKESINEYTAWVKVIGRTHRPAAPLMLAEQHFTVLLVKERFSSKGPTDTLYLLEDHGFECFTGLTDPSIGKEYVLTGRWGRSIWVESGDTLQQQVLVLDLCAKGELRVNEEEVEGFIKKNKYHKDAVKLSEQYVQLQARWEEYASKGYLEGEQRAKYMAQYERQQEKVERKNAQLEKAYREGRYFQRMSMEAFRKWILQRMQ